MQVERVARRRAGLEVDVAKLPFMPGQAIRLGAWLRSHTPGYGAHRARGAAAVGILLAYYFGWRSSTLGALLRADVTATPRLFQFSEAFSKGAFGASHRLRLLQLPHGRLPGVDPWLDFLLADIKCGSV